jgi:hypothetical protein
MRRLTWGLAVCFVVLAGPPARADVLYNNFGPRDSYGSLGFVIGRAPGDTVTWVQGDPFRVTGSDFTLDRLTLALSWALTGPNEVDVQFRADAEGLPGATIESFHFSNLGFFGQNHPPVVADSVLHPLLSAGAQYWVTASASDLSAMAWNWNSTNDVGPHARSQNGGPFDIITINRGAFRVEGTPSPAPEPATLALAGVGLFGMVGFVWRKARSS